MDASAFPAWVNGAWVAPGAPAIAADDQGLQLGMSVFDSLLWEDGRLRFLDLHMERLASGAAELGIAFGSKGDALAGALHPRAALEAYMEHLTAERGWRDPLMLKVTLTRGRPGGSPTVLVTARRPEPLDAGGVVVALAEVQKAAGDHHEHIKSTNRMRNVLALEEYEEAAQRQEFLETQQGDLLRSIDDTQKAIHEIDSDPRASSRSLSTSF